MMVFVATKKQFIDAFDSWISEDPVDYRLIMKRVFEAFIDSDFSTALFAPTGLLCFDLNQWSNALELWRDHEISAFPKSEDSILCYTRQLDDLIRSKWSITFKLVVQECLSDSDLAAA